MQHRFLISAAHKSSGKTTISVGLTAALRQRGLVVQTFKKGPDYIDPLWLSAAAGRPCRNLDAYLSPPEELTEHFLTHGQDADVSLVEGNKGLFDGVDVDGSNSNAALAQLLDLPVILVLDARGITRGIAPLILGYQAFERNIRIVGVVLNRLGGTRHESKLRAVIEHYTDVAVVGALQEDDTLMIPERHLGLVPANESKLAELHLYKLAEAVSAGVDLDRLLVLTKLESPIPGKPGIMKRQASGAATGEFQGNSNETSMARVKRATADVRADQVRIAIAQDAAFGFYYADDLDAFAQSGALLVPFDTLRDQALPEADGLFIGGGFPECFLDVLSANSALRADIHRAIAAGLPTYAECGGLMYLARSISWQGVSRPMVGSIDGEIQMQARPVGRGYVQITTTPTHPWLPEQQTFAAHEFHYSALTALPTGAKFAYKMGRGHGLDGASDGLVQNRLLASYSHLRHTEACPWVRHFVAWVRAQKQMAH